MDRPRRQDRPPPASSSPPVVRRDADGSSIPARSWESLTERLIREAQERGDFDNLPGTGQPLAIQESPYAGDRELAFHMLRNAGVAPPWVEANKELQRLDQELQHTWSRARAAEPAMWPALRRGLEALLDEHDAAVRHHNAEAPTVSQHRLPLNRETARDRLERLLRNPHDPDPA